MRKPGFFSLFLSSFTLTICVLFPYGENTAPEIVQGGRDR